MRSKQEVFDIVAKHLLKQMEPSREGNYSNLCLYRGPNGLKCAVGALIPDELYISAMDKGETTEICAVASKYPSIRPYIGDVDFATELQTLHDTELPEDWKAHLMALAAEHSLDPKVLHAI